MPKKVVNINDLSNGIITKGDGKDYQNSVVDAVNLFFSSKEIEPNSIFKSVGYIDSIGNTAQYKSAFSFSTDYNLNGDNVPTDYIAVLSNTNIIIFEKDNPSNNITDSYTGGDPTYFYAKGFLRISDKNFNLSNKIFGKLDNGHFDSISSYSEDYNEVGFLASGKQNNIKSIISPRDVLNNVGAANKAKTIFMGFVFEAVNEGNQWNDYSVYLTYDSKPSTEDVYAIGKTIFIHLNNFNYKYFTLDEDGGSESFKNWWNNTAVIDSFVSNNFNVRAVKNSDLQNTGILTDKQLENIRVYSNPTTIYYGEDSNYDDLITTSSEVSSSSNSSLLNELNLNYSPGDSFELSGGYSILSYNEEISLSDFNNWFKVQTSFYDNGLGGKQYSVYDSINDIVFSDFVKIDHTPTTHSYTQDDNFLYIFPYSNSVPSLVIDIEKEVSEEKTNWDNDLYSFGCSYSFLDGSESSIKTSFFKTQLNDNEKVKIGIRVANGSSKYNKFAEGIKIYCKSDSKDDWIYLGIFDFNKGFKPYQSESYQEINTIDYHIDDNSKTSANMITQKVMITNPVEVQFNEQYTFEYEAGYKRTDSTEAEYKKGIVVNNRLFAFNIKQNGKTYPDRILISPVNQLDILPESNYIDVVTEDGDEYVSAASFGNEILAFKNNFLYILDVSSGDPSTFYLKGSYNGAGIIQENTVVTTKFGVFWLAENGFMFYNGKAPINISEEYFGSEFLDFINQVSDKIALGYSPKEEKIVIATARNTNIGTDSLDCYVYDITGKYFTKFSEPKNGLNTHISNMINIKNDLYFLTSG